VAVAALSCNVKTTKGQNWPGRTVTTCMAHMYGCLCQGREHTLSEAARCHAVARRFLEYCWRSFGMTQSSSQVAIACILYLRHRFRICRSARKASVSCSVHHDVNRQPVHVDLVQLSVQNRTRKQRSCSAEAMQAFQPSTCTGSMHEPCATAHLDLCMIVQVDFAVLIDVLKALDFLLRKAMHAQIEERSAAHAESGFLVHHSSQ
jgi:hypothetical protein